MSETEIDGHSQRIGIKTDQTERGWKRAKSSKGIVKRLDFRVASILLLPEGTDPGPKHSTMLLSAAQSDSLIALLTNTSTRAILVLKRLRENQVLPSPLL